MACAVLAACGAPEASTGAAAAADDPRTLTVFAAASLNATFTELGAQFEAQHPGVRVGHNFAGSSDLAVQLLQGAPGDVFAAADEVTMGRVVDDGLAAGAPRIFATNTLTIVTGPGNPRSVTGLGNLAQQSASGLHVVVCAPAVPCGAATTALQNAAGVSIRPVSEEQSVTDVLGKVTSGQADAGLVYVTDATRAADAVATVDLPEADSAVNRYPIAALKTAGDPALATAYIDFITAPTARRALQRAGFGAP